jgi:hypothetical protein
VLVAGLDLVARDVLARGERLLGDRADALLGRRDVRRGLVAGGRDVGLDPLVRGRDVRAVVT